MAVVAHPDDEVLGCGVLLARRPDIQLVHVTSGAPADGADATRLGFGSPAAYAWARRGELEAALALAGIGPGAPVSLDIPDQAASLHLAALARRLSPLIEGADVVLTHAYEGGHPDHDATAWAVHAAARRLGAAAPVLVEMPFYRASPDGWLRQEFCPEPGAGPEVVLVPTAAERALKTRMVAAHASQASVLADFPVGVERFRLAPPYRFDRPPNGGLALYHRYPWGTTSATWAERVWAADDAMRAAAAA